MLRKLLFTVMVGVFVCLPLSSVQALMHIPTETIYYNPSLALNGVTIVTPMMSTAGTFLIDNDGRLIHKIASGGHSIWHAEALDNGNFARSIGVAANQNYSPLLGMMGAYNVQEVNWWGNQVKLFNTYTSQFGQHHDFQRIYNKKLKAYTYIFVAYTAHSMAEAMQLGANYCSSAGWSPDSVVEMNYAGEVVWMWQFYNHTCATTTTGDPTNPYYQHVADLSTAPGRLDINVLNYGMGAAANNPAMDWNHVNSLDYNQDLDYIVLNSRDMNEFYVIDHGKTFKITTKDPVTGWQANIDEAAGPNGDFIYRFGCPSNYNAGAFAAFGTNGSEQIYGAHQVQWIHSTAYKNGPALPGAGHFIIFDNGATNNNPISYFTKIPEINPYLYLNNGVLSTATTYKDPPTAGYKTVAGASLGMGATNQSQQIVWSFWGNHCTSFTSNHISGTQRLPNGNTLSCSGEYGHLVEVTSSKTQAWEYINPIYNGKPVKFINDPSMQGPNSVFRAYKYDVGHPAFKNRVVQYADGTIQPYQKQPGVGFTLTGAVPCRSIPCQYVGSP